MTANGSLGPLLHFILLLAIIHTSEANGIHPRQRRPTASKLHPRSLIRTRKALATNVSTYPATYPPLSWHPMTMMQDSAPLAADHRYEENEWSGLELPPPPPFPKDFSLVNPFSNRGGALLPGIQNTQGSVHAPPLSAHDCGGLLKARHGIIHTPNFPQSFDTPIDCLWVIDGSEFIANTGQNISIAVHLTQLYVLGGLTFTEYMYYSDDYRVPAQRFYALTEDDVTQLSSLLFNSQYLEIRFRLSGLDGTHLRALDHLLDVYGFNITYEINEPPKPYHCNVLQCRLLGHCYANDDFR